MTSAPKTSPLSTEIELDESSLNAIRSILAEGDAALPPSRMERSESVAATPVAEAAPVRCKADALPDLACAETSDISQEVTPKRKFGFFLRRKPAAPREVAPKTISATPKNRRNAGAGLLDRLRAYRPTVAHIVLGAFVLVVLLRPWLVGGLLALSIFIVIGVFLIAGYDGFWHGAIKASRWYARRRPSRAEVLHARLDRFAVRWDAVLDRFPEGTVDGLYLPDFAELETADARHDEVVERRLAGMREKGA